MSTTELTNELKDRATSGTPDFWRYIQIGGVSAILLGTILINFPVSIPAILVSTGSTLITVGTTASTISQFAKAEPGEQTKPTIIETIANFVLKFVKK